MFENKALRKIFGPQSDKVRAEWRRIQKEELHNLYFSSITVRVMKSRIMRQEGHVAYMGERRGAQQDLVGKN